MPVFAPLARTLLCVTPLLMAAVAHAQPNADADRPGDGMRAIESFVNHHHDAIFGAREDSIRGEFEDLLWRHLDDGRATGRADAYRYLLDLAESDPAFPTERARRIADGISRLSPPDPELIARSAIVLAERGGQPAAAIEMVRSGMGRVQAQIEQDRRWFESDEEAEDVAAEQYSILTDALGWVYHLAGDTDSSEVVLLRAHALWTSNVVNLWHLGRLYEAADRLERAEKFYHQGALVAAPEINPNRAAMRQLYERTRGSLDGWDAFADAYRNADEAARREQILGGRAPRPESMPGFSLASLDGRTVTHTELDGRVAVINFWGTWCGWCVREMPDFQRLHERYVDDDTVRIVTINNDADWGMVREWMSAHDYAFEVLRDDGYIDAAARVSGFPTTWFVGPDGRILYEKRGWTEKLLDEFSWRIEAMKEELIGSAAP